MKLITWKWSDNSDFGIFGLFQDDALATAIHNQLVEVAGDWKTFKIHDIEFMDSGRFIIKGRNLTEDEKREVLELKKNIKNLPVENNK